MGVDMLAKWNVGAARGAKQISLRKTLAVGEKFVHHFARWAPELANLNLKIRLLVKNCIHATPCAYGREKGRVGLPMVFLNLSVSSSLVFLRFSYGFP